MTMRRHLRTTLCGLAAVLGLMSVLHESSARAGDKPTTLIPGYVDADGTVHPEKLLSYVDALHRAANADVAEARIAQLQAHLSQVVATLGQTRDLLARQTQLAENRGKEIARVASLHKAGQTARASLRQSDRSRLQSEFGELITSLQQSQTQGARLATTLDRTQASLASTTAERDASRQQVTQLTAANGKLDAQFKSTRTQLASTRKSLDITRKSLAATSDKLKASAAELAKSQQQLKVAEAAKTNALADLKELADKSKPVTVEPDTKSQDGKDPKDDDENPKPADKPKAAPEVESDDEGS
jgi:chromosome segregation ATPase